MSVKIKNIDINGLRGIKDTLALRLNGKSILLFGENGSGKSSITDSIEWCYTDRVSHLSGSEVDLKEALRNSNLKEDEESSLKIEYSRSILNCEKKIFYKRKKLVSEISNSTDEFDIYIKNSERENLLLRYHALRSFIENTKGEKLKYLSDVIGYSEVTKTKDVLRKAVTSIKSEIKSQNFENQVTTQKSILIDKINASVGQEKDLFEKINEIIKPLKIGSEIKSFVDIDEALEKIKKPTNNALVLELKFLEDSKELLNSLKNEVNFFDEEYKTYYNEFETISKDVESIMQTFLAELLKAGNDVIVGKYHKEETCPLCLQPKKLKELKEDIENRLKAIEESSTKKASFDKTQQTVIGFSTDRIKRLDSILSEKIINEKSNKKIETAVNDIKLRIDRYQKAGKEKVTSGNKIAEPDSLKLNDTDFEIISEIDNRITKINKSFENDNSTIIYSNIAAAKDAFLKIQSIAKEQKKLENQRGSLEIIYDEFIKKQKEGLENFISFFSEPINEFYQFMNPGELIHEIKIVIIGEEDELNGLTIEYDFNGKLTSPPQKYFSESHLNCFGLAFFLTSVKAFNKENKFIILDDVISSFDTTHRERFANLIFEKFSDYQIIMLTHEREWFQYVSQNAKRKGWLINEIRWSNKIGTYIDSEPKEVRELINHQLTNGLVEHLGNPIRKYLEQLLKEICYNTEVKVGFRYNDVNEKRMPYELFNELKSKINKHSVELKKNISIIERVACSAILGNLLSHSNPFNPALGDLKAFWTDILELEKLFYCIEEKCAKPIALKNYDNVKKRIRCSCDNLNYDWRK
jgi:energy-coupling factor transporter ATP-binding protein EcfA2